MYTQPRADVTTKITPPERTPELTAAPFTAPAAITCTRNCNERELSITGGRVRYAPALMPEACADYAPRHGWQRQARSCGLVFVV
jgi:hypothetical protein